MVQGVCYLFTIWRELFVIGDLNLRKILFEDGKTGKSLRIKCLDF